MANQLDLFVRTGFGGLQVGEQVTSEVWRAYQDLCLNRPSGHERLFELLSESEEIKKRYVSELGNDEDRFIDCCHFLIERFRHQRHRKHDFANASALIGTCSHATRKPVDCNT